MKNTMKVLSLALACVLALLPLTSCGIFHKCEFGAWETVSEATIFDSGLQQRTCECGETEEQEIPALGLDKAHELLKGTWYEQADKVPTAYIEFDNGKFTGGFYISEAYPFVKDGTYTITEEMITCTQPNGGTWDRYKYEIKNGEILLKDYSDGISYGRSPK